MQKTKIEWTDIAWNPVTGCSKLSEGCQNCYAERMAKRLCSMGSKWYRNGFQVTVHHDLIERPLLWTKPRMIFVNSMSDLFHEDVPEKVIFEILDVICRAKQHTFQILTKRPERMVKILAGISLPTNLWLGVSVESEKYLKRIEDLQKTTAAVRFISFEPLLSRIEDFPLVGTGWVIVGAESGPRRRSMNIEWVRGIKNRCIRTGIAFFFKQAVIEGKMVKMPELDGRIWNEMPAMLG